MRPFTSIAAVLATSLGLVASLPAQTTVSTVPVGFNTTTIASGRLAALSLPFDNISAFSGGITSRTASSITTTGAAFGSLSAASAPHVVRFVSGSSIGRQFRITANTTDTLTLATGGVDLTTATANGDTYDVIPVHTLGSFFGAAPDANKPAINRNGDPNLADNVLLRGTFGYLTYYNDGTKWLLVGGGNTVQNDVPLFSDQGFLFQRRSGSALSITMLGSVPRSALRTDLLANRTTIFPNRFPVDTTLNGLNLHSNAQWNKNDDPNLADNILIRGSFGWLTYYVNAAGQWRLSGGGTTDQGATAVPLNSAVLAVRRAGSTVTLTQNLPYNL